MPAAIYTTDEASTALDQVSADRIYNSSTLTTTDNSVHTILTIPTTAGTSYAIHVFILAKRTDTTGTWSRFRTISANDVATVVTIDGNTVVSTDGSGLVTGVTAGTSAINLTVTGNTAQTWDWKCRAVIVYKF